MRGMEMHFPVRFRADFLPRMRVSENENFDEVHEYRYVAGIHMAHIDSTPFFVHIADGGEDDEAQTL